MKIQSVKAVLSLNYAELHEHTSTPAQRGKKITETDDFAGTHT